MNFRTAEPARAEHRFGRTRVAPPAMPAGCVHAERFGKALPRQKGPTRSTQQNGACGSPKAL
eukprot:8675746-Lingulodinium_polyedra.AAC.1